LNDEEKELFHKFCVVLAKELVPYLNKCVQILFSSKSMGITKSASCIISLDIDKLTNPLLPMMPVNVVEPTVDTEHHHNVDTLTDSNTKNNPVSITQSDSDDRLAGTEENAAIGSENNESSSQDERQRTDDTLSSEHSEIPINVPS
jgi:hypothetical protein